DDAVVGEVVENVAHPAGQLAAFRFLETTGGGGRGAHAQAGGDEGAARVVGHGILVDGNVGAAQGSVCVLAGDVLLDQAHQKEMVFSAAGHHVETARHEHVSHGLG